jgi:hypothetical protein
MQANMQSMIRDAEKLSKDMLCRYVVIGSICLQIFSCILTQVCSSDMIWSLCGVSMGFLGEVVKLSEKNRWLPGSSRYYNRIVRWNPYIFSFDQQTFVVFWNLGMIGALCFSKFVNL